MTEKQTPTQEKLSHAYHTMVERINDSLKQISGNDRLQKAFKSAREKSVELSELTQEESEKVGKYLARDLQQAQQYLSNTGHELGDWFHLDMELIENRLWEFFSHAADQTSLELLQLKDQAHNASEYHTGEITAPGVLECTACKGELHFKKAGHIPPCPKCRGKVFSRKSRNE